MSRGNAGAVMEARQNNMILVTMLLRMGQKVHPYGFRLGVATDWTSTWYVESKDYSKYLLIDLSNKWKPDTTFPLDALSTKLKNKS